MAVPVEDIPDTPYDESEMLPFESTPLFSTEMPQAPGGLAKAEPSCDFLLALSSLTERHQAVVTTATHAADVLTILSHSLRC